MFSFVETNKLFELWPFMETVIPHNKILLCRLGLL